MSKFRKLMAAAALLFVSSSVFVACSDDDGNTFGALPVNSVVVTGTTADIIWSIVPNSNCEGYEVTLLQGSRDGNVVETKTLDNRTCQVQFTNLTPGTTYVVKTQAIPGKGYSSAEPYYREFTTAPVMIVSAASYDVYQETESFVRDSFYVAPDSILIADTTLVVNGGIIYHKGDTIKAKGDTIRVKIPYDSLVTYSSVTLTWPAIPSTQCGGYSLTIYDCAVDTFKVDKPNGAVVANTQTANTTVTIKGLKPAKKYTVASSTQPNAMCDYAAGDLSVVGIETPANK